MLIFFYIFYFRAYKSSCSAELSMRKSFITSGPGYSISSYALLESKLDCDILSVSRLFLVAIVLPEVKHLNTNHYEKRLSLHV